MFRILLVSAALSLAGAAVSAQQAASPPAAPPPAPVAEQTSDALQIDQLKMQVRSFEAVLRTAVENGGRRLAKRAEEVFPMTPPLAMAGEPAVLGLPHPDGGFTFTVQVPDILSAYAPIVNILRERPNSMGAAGPTRVGATGVVADDPVTPRADFNPDQEYSDYVREALIDAMLENSSGLSITGTHKLVVVASVSNAVRRNPLDVSRLLILSVEGDQLMAYRQGKLTKAELRLKVVDRRF